MTTHGSDRVQPDGRGRSRVLCATLAGAGVLASVAVPAGQAALLALVSFSGCFLECGDPSPVRGVLWSSLALVLLGLPVVVGALVARFPMRRVWPWAVCLLICAGIVLSLLQRVM